MGVIQSVDFNVQFTSSGIEMRQATELK